MKRATLAAILGTALCAGILPVHASAAETAKKPSINKVERREQVRIRKGIRSGELTRTEAERLEAQQAKIRVDEKFARDNGSLSAKERARLDKELQHASHAIHQQKHDKQEQK